MSSARNNQYVGCSHVMGGKFLFPRSLCTYLCRTIMSKLLISLGVFNIFVLLALSKLLTSGQQNLPQLLKLSISERIIIFIQHNTHNCTYMYTNIFWFSARNNCNIIDVNVQLNESK